MSVASGDNDLESAAGRATATNNTVEENLIVLEASEDREIHAVQVQTVEDSTTAEVSFSNSMLLDSAATDETASGILLAYNRTARGSSLIELPAPVRWSAGEELNVHCDNASSNNSLVAVVVHYQPVGEFRRSRLRNQ